MRLQDIPHMDKGDVLALLGLETKHSNFNRIFGALGIFGVGLLVGAGAALLLAPKAGSDLRRDLRAKMQRHNGFAVDSTDGADAGETSYPEKASPRA